MNKNSNLEKTILTTITNHNGMYPITTRELECKCGVSNPVILKNLERIQKQGLIHSLRVIFPSGYKNLYLPSESPWPVFLSQKCFKCQNKSTIKTCIFHNLLHELGYSCDLSRVKIKLTKETTACPWFIPRGRRIKEMPLDKFLKVSYKRSLKFNSNLGVHNSLLPNYLCLFCNEPLHSLGSGFIPLFGSSIVRCLHCESAYKLVYDKKKDKFMVLCAEEKGHLFKANFQALAGKPVETIPYSSEKYGIAIPNETTYHLDLNTETLTVANWIGRISDLDYIVTRNEKDYLELKRLLSKDYWRIEIIDGLDKLSSPPPEPQQVGLLKLIRKLKVLNKRFCKATLDSRLIVLTLLKGKVSEQLREKAVTVIKNQIKKLSRYQLLLIEDWNLIDALAANAIWMVIGELAEKHDFDFPGRCLARNVHCPYKPFSSYYAYSGIDSIINGLFLKISENIKEYCTKINFCWDGLPGFCHGKTHGGEFGFHLDLIEPFKLILLLTLCDALENGTVNSEELTIIYGRRRQKLFSINPNSELNLKLDEMIEQSLKCFNLNYNIRFIFEKYFLEIRNWLSHLVKLNYQNQITHHGQLFNYNVLLDYQIWTFLSKEQQLEILRKMNKLLVDFQPYTINLTN